MNQDSMSDNVMPNDSALPQAGELRADFSVSMFDHSDIAFCVIKVELDESGQPVDWTFAYANDALAKIEGVERQKLVGSRFFELFPNGDRACLPYYYQAAYEGKNVDFEDVSEADDFYLRVDAMPMGTPGYCGVTLRDIREEYFLRQNTNQALQEALIASERANNAKSSFLTSMSHDIRTPMNAIIGMTALAAAHIGEEERVTDCLRKISTSSKHLLSLINEVLDMSKIETGQVLLTDDEFNLAELMDNLVVMIHQQLETREHEFYVVSSELEHENVVGDSLRIQQIFVNIMSNAIKYTPDGGKIRLSVSERATDDPMVATYVFVFEDNGIGMDEDFLAQVFEPFTREDDAVVANAQGTGLGMPISRNIARMMGGDVTVESTKGVGTRVTVEINLKLQDEKAPRLAEDAFVDLDVLVADDDQDSLDSVCLILDELGMNPEGVTSGQAAVDSAVIHHEQSRDFYACILDWKMPNMDGVETTRRIRAAVGEDVPIIIISAYDVTAVEEEAREAGANAFITKPLFRSRLARTFHAITTGEEEAKRGDENPVHDFSEANYAGKRALLVEDNELNSEIAQELLEMTNLEVECAFDGAAAVEKLANCKDGYYDIVFMDIQMPKMNGNDATRAIRSMKRAYCRQVPIVAMTANAFAEDVQAAKTVGMNEHIAKPLDLKRLAVVLDKWLG